MTYAIQYGLIWLLVKLVKSFYSFTIMAIHDRRAALSTEWMPCVCQVCPDFFFLNQVLLCLWQEELSTSGISELPSKNESIQIPTLLLCLWEKLSARPLRVVLTLKMHTKRCPLTHCTACKWHATSASVRAVVYSCAREIPAAVGFYSLHSHCSFSTASSRVGL